MIKSDLPSTISTHIFHSLRQKIIEGELQPGKALREEEIREKHGSSRGPIRESLRLLLQTGLVEHQPRKGFRVRHYNPLDIKQIYELRANLEAQVIDDLTGRDLTPLTASLKEICERMNGFYAQNNRKSYFTENECFHSEIILFANNRILLEIMDYVNEVSLPVRYRLLGDALPSRRSLTYHETIVELLEQGNIEKAKYATEHHILENINRAVAAYSKDQIFSGINK